MQKITDNIFLLVIIAMVGTFLLAGSFIFFFIRAQRRMLAQKEIMQKAALEHREALLHAAIQSQEEERKRIGRDLHDDVGSALSNLRMVLGNNVDTQVTHKPLIDNIITTVRNISHTLSPPGLELFGLDYALHELCDTFNISGKIKLVFENNATEETGHIGLQNALTIYRVMQELISNTVKHANATTITITINKANRILTFLYNDNGVGVTLTPSKKAGMGMQNIEGRLSMINASYEIESSPGNGFNILIKLSLPETV